MAKLTGIRRMRVFVMLICSIITMPLLAQKNYKVNYLFVDSPITANVQSLGLDTSFYSFLEANQYYNKLPQLLQAKGFIGSSIDTVIDNQNNSSVYLFLGQKYPSLILRTKDTDQLYLQQVGWQQKSKKGEQFNFNQYYQLTEKLLDYFETSGYPFAKLNLDSIQILGEKIIASLNIDKGVLYKIDSIRMYGPGKISKGFIHHYLAIEPGSAYNKSKFDKINQRLLELPYIEQSRPWDITMLNTGSLVNLYLQRKRSNQINVLAGFLPSNQQLGGKLLFTVDANLRLQNSFGSGETLGLVWQQIQPKSPRVNLQYTQPYIFNSSFGVDFLFDLFKRDSAFLNINGQLGIQYIISPTQTAKFIIQTQRTNILEIDTMAVKASRRLPDVADVSSLNLGFDYELSNTDYKYNPRKGNEFTISALAGNKTTRKNNTISQLKDASFNYNELYDSVKLKTYQVRMRLKAAHYFKTGKLTVLKTAINAGIYESPQFFRNELFQIGGYRSLRGFDEEAIFSNQYLIGTLEYRFLLDLNSNFFVFSDYGVSNNKIVNQTNSFLGAGLGISYQTKGGIFNISYAAGKRNDLNFDIKQSKIHFGFVSIF